MNAIKKNVAKGANMRTMKWRMIFMSIGVLAVWMLGSSDVMAASGSYSINYKASNPLMYEKYLPEQIACSAVGGIDVTPLSGAEFIGGVESLTPKDMALGQVVAFQFLVTVNGSVTPENGVIEITGGWSTQTTANHEFGFDETYGIYCAFVDAGDSQHIDTGSGAHVSGISWSVIKGEIQGTFELSGLDHGDRVALEVWLVLDRVLPDKVSGNVPSRLIAAKTAAGSNINTGSQTIPLQKVSDFQMLSAVGDLVWLDSNKNGIQDLGEVGIGGVRVELYGTNDVLVAWQNTDINGNYLFSSLAPGDYYVMFSLPANNYTFSSQFQGVDPAKDSNADPSTGKTPVFSLLGNETDRNVDAGMYIKPTRVVLTDFYVERLDGALSVLWATSEEQGAIGFFLERWDAAAGAYVRVNEALVPAAFDSYEPRDYRVVDAGASASGTVTYRLLELENTGAVNRYGPFVFDLGAAAGGGQEEQSEEQSTVGADAPAQDGGDADGDDNGVGGLALEVPEAPRVTSVQGVNGSVVLRWASVEGAVYGIERAASLTGEFLPLVSGLPSTAPENVVILVDGAQAAFFSIVREN